MILKQLLSEIAYTCLSGDLNVDISDVVYDSRLVSPGSLFVCLRGFVADGHRYVDKAIAAGAAAVVVEDASVVTDGAVFVLVADSRLALAYISAAFFGKPAEKMTMIGLTGTKGKTTTAHMIKNMLEKAGHTVGMIGTMGAYIGNEKTPTKNTTPESHELHALFDKMYRAGCTHVVMEVSSQGLKQQRTAGITFDVGAFLNLSEDHIGDGEHKDFEEYKACKKLLIPQCRRMVINADTPYSEEFSALSHNPVTISTETAATLSAQNRQNLWDGALFGVAFDAVGLINRRLTVSMPGLFNVENALVAAAIAHLCGVSDDKIGEGLATISVKGRTQLIPGTPEGTVVLIDYAHNALSMESLLTMLKGYHPQRLICLFGGGGNKPKQRRYDMGLIAGKYADLTVLTTDNPRFEELADINAHIIEGLNVHGGRYEIIDDRQEALEYLLENARSGDIIAVIGKGHETYQEIKGVRYDFCEEEIIRNFLTAHAPTEA